MVFIIFITNGDYAASVEAKKSAMSSNSSAHALCAMPAYVLNSTSIPFSFNNSYDFCPYVYCNTISCVPCPCKIFSPRARGPNFYG